MTEASSTPDQYLRRRRVPRRKIKRKIGLLVQGEYSICWAYEVGEGGMLISSNVPLLADQKMVITFSLPGLSTVMRATVRYIRQPQKDDEEIRYGVQFEDVGFDAKRKIRNFVASSTQKNEASA